MADKLVSMAIVEEQHILLVVVVGRITAVVPSEQVASKLAAEHISLVEQIA